MNSPEDILRRVLTLVIAHPVRPDVQASGAVQWDIWGGCHFRDGVETLSTQAGVSSVPFHDLPGGVLGAIETDSGVVLEVNNPGVVLNTDFDVLRRARAFSVTGARPSLLLSPGLARFVARDDRRCSRAFDRPPISTEVGIGPPGVLTSVGSSASPADIRCRRNTGVLRKSGVSDGVSPKSLRASGERKRSRTRNTVTAAGASGITTPGAGVAGPAEPPIAGTHEVDSTPAERGC